MRMRALGEDVEDHAAAVQHLDVEQSLQLTHLLGRELVIGHEGGEVEAGFGFFEFLGLARSQIPHRMDPFPVLRDSPHDLGPGRLDEGGQLAQGLLGGPPSVIPRVHGDEIGPLLRPAPIVLPLAIRPPARRLIAFAGAHATGARGTFARARRVAVAAGTGHVATFRLRGAERPPAGAPSAGVVSVPAPSAG